MPRKMLLIHPKDDTTKFLLSPIAFFTEKIPKEQLDLQIIEPNQASHEACFSAINAKNYDLIFFLGHGSSEGVQGSSSEIFECTQMITIPDLKGIEDKFAIFLSCNSRDFLKKSKMSHIGFGFMPTDWHDIQSAREYDYKAYEGVIEDDINTYRMNLTEILKKPLLKYLNNENYTVTQCYYDIILYINQIIAINYKELNRPNLAYLMFELKQDIVLKIV